MRRRISRPHRAFERRAPTLEGLTFAAVLAAIGLLAYQLWRSGTAPPPADPPPTVGTAWVLVPGLARKSAYGAEL